MKTSSKVIEWTDAFRMPMKSNIRRNGRRRGVAYIYLALGMLVFLGITGLVIDIGHLHMKEAQAMRAADAAALAGAMQLPDEARALQVARDYAALNRYRNGQGGAVVTGNVDSGNPNRYTVHVERPEPLFFIRALPGVGSLRNVGATATAEVEMPQDLEADMHVGSGEGVGPINLAVFGPQARYSYGDAYSPQWLDDGRPNPRYDGEGYNFRLTIPTDYVTRNGTSMVDVQIFDPDGQNLDGNPSPNGTTRIDEIMNAPGAPHPQPTNKYTTTRYQLYKIVDPKDPSKDRLISEAAYGLTNPEIDMKWVTPQGFSFNLNDYGPGAFRINVKTVDGSSENGFNLRAVAPGNPTPVGEAGGENPNGTSISAMGRLPINFNTNGLTTLALGIVPTQAAGKTLTIDKFDTDVGAEQVYFTSDPPASNQPPGGFVGILSANGGWQADHIDLPADYTTAKWFATYTAGHQDTTVWELSYSTPNAVAGGVRLVGRDGKPY